MLSNDKVEHLNSRVMMSVDRKGEEDQKEIVVYIVNTYASQLCSLKDLEISQDV